MHIRFYNTLTKTEEPFVTLTPGKVRMYNCGPTVYDRQHIGNLSMAIFADTLRRALEYGGYEVRQVMNITDFGHLSGDNEGDADHGEDRMSKGLRREGKTLTMENMRDLATRYMEIYFTDLDALGIDRSRIVFPRASDYIPQQIEMIHVLEEKGYAYRGEEGVYFDTAKFPRYGELGGIDLAGLKAGARVAVHADKRNPADFLLWKFDATLGWPSEWGLGFPGWHIECSAMIRACLGDQIDIHTGGPEHVAIHHNNEIAQSECATGTHPFSRFWLHRAWVQMAGGKMAKSDGNVAYLSDIVERGYDPLVFRYWLLTAHYRTPSNFTWEALEGAKNAYQNLLQRLSDAPLQGVAPAAYMDRFRERISDDLDTPGALAVLWEMTKDSSVPPADMRAGWRKAEHVLGLGLDDPERPRVGISINTAVAPDTLGLSPKALSLFEDRERARDAKDWKRADELRAELAREGYEVKDTPDGQVITRQN